MAPEPQDIMALAAALQYCRDRGIIEAVVDYSGSGDSGCVEEVYGHDAAGKHAEIGDEAVSAALEEAAMSVVEERWGGWENNDGASGNVTIDTATGEAEFEHTINVISTEEDSATRNLLTGEEVE